MSITPLFTSLPPEIKEQILSSLVSLYAHDPVHQWIKLRHLTRTQKRNIESDFAAFWLKHITLTVYPQRNADRDFVFKSIVDPAVPMEDQVVVFSNAVEPQQTNRRHARTADQDPPLGREWEKHGDLLNRNVTIRFGEGILNKGLLGGYVVNDAFLHGLSASPDGSVIKFKWYQVVQDLMQEEALLRAVTPSLIEGYMKGVIEARDIGERSDEIYTLCYHVQMARRVKVIQRRVERLGPEQTSSFHFGRYSSHLHNQPVSETPGEQRPSQAYCSICSRRSGPDLFEVIQAEESMIPYSSYFQRWVEGELDDLAIFDAYTEEFGWACSIMTGGGADWQRQRADEFRHSNGFVKSNGSKPSTKRIRDYIHHTGRRWDILG